MSQLKTHLLIEDPTIILIGDSGVFIDKIAKMLQNQNLQVRVVDSRDFLQEKNNSSVINDVYKVVWLHEYNAGDTVGYLKMLEKLKTVKTPIVVVASLISNIDSSDGNLLNNWKVRSEKQIQFIVDCTYYLPRASFIFGENVIFSGVHNTSLEFMTQDIHKGVIIDPGVGLGFVEVEDFVKSFKKHLFAVGKQRSVLIRGKIFDSGQVVNLLKKLYDSYHKVNTRLISKSIELADSVPFSTEEVMVGGSLRNIVTKVVRNFLPPGKNDVDAVIEKPDESLKKVRKSIESPDLGKKKDIVSDKNIDVGADVTTDVDVDDEIQRIFNSSRANTKVGRIKKIVKNTGKNTRKSKRKRFLFAGGIGATGVATGVILLVLTFFISQSILKKELSDFLSGEIIVSDGEITENSGLKNITNFIGLQAESYDSIIDSDLINRVTLMVRISKGVQSIPQILPEVDKASKNLFLQIVDGDIGKTSELAQILGYKAQLVYEKLSSIQAILNKVSLSIGSNDREGLISNYEVGLKEIRSKMLIKQQLSPTVSSLTGEISKKTYAVILQNNQELRPTGGFIQAVALLNFDEGVLASYKVYSVYELDRRLPGEISPPEDLKKYLGEEKWYLRDSNWSPDFPTTSKQIGWFLNKSLGINVDGVIGMNLFTIKEILEATGPMDLSKYNEVITHKNILERMEFHSEVVLVDSPNSIDYSVSILEELISKVVGIDDDKIPALLSSFEDSLNDNQLLISMFEESEQSVFHNLGWTGSLIKPQCPTQLSVVDCVVDVFVQVEANVGVNKANYYLDREIDHSVKINRKEALHKREISFKNNAKSNSWPKGTYRSYQRFYVDKETVLDQILIDGNILVENQFSINETGNFMEIGIKVDVPIQKQVVIELNYSTPHEFANGFSYVFFNQKQSGTSGDSFEVSFEYSDDMSPVLIAPSAEVYGNEIVFEENSGRSLFGVEFE